MLFRRLYSVYKVSRLPRNPPSGMRRLLHVVTNSLPAAVAATCCRGGFLVNWDTVNNSNTVVAIELLL
jgi:hypothetical protein